LLNLATGHGSAAQRRAKDLQLTDLPPFDDADLFDEAGYLRLYPGIAEAMMQGRLDSAWNHYFHHGRDEGRLPNDVDPAFYLAAYPEMERDLGHPPSEADAAPHFITIGRARGYRPNANAPRAANAAAPPSPFGGFWTDQANALDLIQARLDLGRLRRRDAAMLRTFALDGIVEIDRPHDKEQFDAATLMVEQAFTGAFPELLFSRPGAGAEPWHPELTGLNVAVLDPHMLSRAIREMLLDKVVIDFLSVLFDARPRLTASQAFPRREAPPERDVAWHAYSLPLQFVAVTFALDDSVHGPDLVWPGSHRLADLPWADGHVSLPEARRAGSAGLERAMARREDLVRGLVRGQEPRRLEPTSGTRTVRHANLIQAVTAPEPPERRRSLTAWYCPSYVSPCYVETTRARNHVLEEYAFSSGVYPAMDPRD